MPPAVAAARAHENPGRALARPELLAPAGDRQAMTAAVENGADAVYFGLQRYSARARAVNFDGDDLPEVMASLHARGVRGYVAMNTLVFPRELAEIEAALRAVVAAGVDAIIVQDLGMARLAREIAPELELHASTQMSITDAAGIRMAKRLGCARVILARELSLDDIAAIRRESELPVEVFVHGALCVAYSGQCLTSEALGGRSANRGECAQACRMPYEIICDGELRDLGDTKYLLSPQDLAAYDLVPKLIDLGVASLKIEGRLKSAEYVANVTRHYRRAIDAALEGTPRVFSDAEVRDVEMSFSRGFTHGFFDGTNHKEPVRGDRSKKRGVFLGTVVEVDGPRVRVELVGPVKKGDGVVFDGDESSAVPEQGGRVYQVAPAVPSRRGRIDANFDQETTSGSVDGGLAELAFGRDDIDVRRIRRGQRVWKTDDPELSKRLRATFEGPPHRKVDVDVHVEARPGALLRVRATTSIGTEAVVESDFALESADRLGADEGLFREQLGRLGGTIYELRAVEAKVENAPLVPKSVLNQLRRALVARLDAAGRAVPTRTVADGPALPALLAAADSRGDQTAATTDESRETPRLAVLCRTTAQVEAALQCGIRDLYADYQDITRYREAVAAVAGTGARLWLATPRIQKPGEANLMRVLAKFGAHGILTRHCGGLEFATREGIPWLADFAMNATNALTVELLRSWGAERVTAGFDLGIDQLLDLLGDVPGAAIEVVVHHHMPMFHMEHCVFCAFLSPGTDKTNCGRPCDEHEVRLRDRVGAEHRLTADVGCRNTLFHATPQSAAEFLPKLRMRGASWFRVELLDETAAEAERTVRLYLGALSGRVECRALYRELRAEGRYGVTRGALTLL